MAHPAHYGQSVAMGESLSADGISPGQRLLAAVVTVISMWLAAWFGVVIGLVAPISGMETGDPDSGETVSRLAFAGAFVLFLLSAPAGYLISRRRWMLLAPVALGVVAGAGVLIAAVT